VGAFNVGIVRRTDDMHPDVICYDLGHEPIDPATGGGDEAQHIDTTSCLFKRAFDRSMFLRMPRARMSNLAFS
jgi:hypothetical protein